MIRKIAFGAATTLLVVGLPVAALGLSPGLDDPASMIPGAPVQLEIQEQLALNEQLELEAQEQIGTPSEADGQAEIQTQARDRNQEMIHVGTDIPDGEEPASVQTQARVQEHNSDQAQTNTQVRAEDGESQGEPAGSGDGYRHGQTDDAPKGNAESEPPADCTNEGGTGENGPHGKNG